jgi:tetratricopeptide (TPR) repeat protein
MPRHPNIDRLLSEWPYEPDSVNVRIVHGNDGRDVLQMRVDMGVLQLETTGRPDGSRPDGFETSLDSLVRLEVQDADFELSERQCMEIDREFVQFYHRRICWLTLREFERAVADADHTLALMDFSSDHSPSEHWTMSHEQYRPFVMFHRIQAAALADLERDAPERAIHQLNTGIERLQEMMEDHLPEEWEDEEELVSRLAELRESLRDHYQIGRTLQEQLDDAVAREEYERAARIRDQLARRRKRNTRSRP